MQNDEMKTNRREGNTGIEQGGGGGLWGKKKDAREEEW